MDGELLHVENTFCSFVFLRGCYMFIFIIQIFLSLDIVSHIFMHVVLVE